MKNAYMILSRLSALAKQELDVVRRLTSLTDRSIVLPPGSEANNSPVGNLLGDPATNFGLRVGPDPPFLGRHGPRLRP